MSKIKLELYQSEVITLRNALRRYLRHGVINSREKVIALNIANKLPVIKVNETLPDLKGTRDYEF